MTEDIVYCDKHPNIVKTKTGSSNRLKCKSCNAEYQAKWYLSNQDIQISRVRQNAFKSRIRNRQFVADYLKDKSCIFCDEKDLDLLEFDHIDAASKIYAISHIVYQGMSLDILKEELEKCQILCVSCHRKRTRKQLNWRSYTNPSDNVVQEIIKEETVILDLEELKETKKCLDCPKEITFVSERCRQCASNFKSKQNLNNKITWPSDLELQKLVWEKPCSDIGPLLGVSDKAIEKRCKKRNIPKPPRGFIKKYVRHTYDHTLAFCGRCRRLAYRHSLVSMAT